MLINLVKLFVAIRAPINGFPLIVDTVFHTFGYKYHFNPFTNFKSRIGT